ncbi:MAG: DUF3107 domain-containing protein, partial [Kineosporiaceae bacterium]
EETPDAVAELVSSAITSQGMLQLKDEKGRLVMVPGPLIGYVEIGAPESRRVGFGTL